MDYASGDILTENGFKKGYIGFSKRRILEICYGNFPKKPMYKGLIVPSFVNAHTHLGDSFIKDKNVEIPKNILDLVAPPDGLKHKLLKEATDHEIIEGIEKSLYEMKKNGTEVFCDFRECGILGICQLKSALNLWNIKSLILSRPDRLEYNKNEIDILLNNSDGIGLSSISDWNYPDLLEISKHVKKKKKMFCIHASERVREDIDKILDLKPDHLVHMIKASKSDLEIVKDNEIPIVICPKSNSFFGLKPKYKLLKDLKIDVLIGTDNAMINSPNLLDEIKFIKKQTNQFSIEELLTNITYLSRKVLNLSPCILGPNSSTGFIIIDKKSLKPLYNSCDK